MSVELEAAKRGETELRQYEIDDLMVTKTASDIIDRLWSLRRLNIPACWIFEGDDGPEHYETCESLLDYIEDYGGKLIRLGSYDVELIHKQSICAGRFLVQID